MNESWIADRMRNIDASGIRKAFDMARSMKDPINLSIGLPDFDPPEAARTAAIEAIEGGFHAYTQTQGIPELRGKLQAIVDESFAHSDRQVIVTSGSSGGLLLALSCVVNPGDEVILFDPYFVMYRHLVTLAGGTSVVIDTYGDDFQINVEKVAAAITPRTKCVLVNSPGNPTGVVASTESMKALAELCRERDILLISDEVYRAFCYDAPFVSPATFNPDVFVADGFSKSHGMTGWRLGYAHGPSRLIQEIAKLQQFSFVCAPSISQKAGVAALDADLSEQSAIYKRKRDAVIAALSDCYDLVTPRGAFYAFPKAPWGTGGEFVLEAIKHNLLIIPGNVFSRKDTHFRISYAVDDRTLERGLGVLREMAKHPSSR